MHKRLIALAATALILLSFYPAKALAPVFDAKNRLRWSPETCRRLVYSDSFSRLSNVLGFTGCGNNLVNNYKELAVGLHDKRVGELGFKIACQYGNAVDAEKCRFLGLVHDLSAVPFRHFAMQGVIGQISKTGGFDFRAHTVNMLRGQGYHIDLRTERDILHFDINDPHPVSDECKIALACESVEGAVEDILLALRFGIIDFKELVSNEAVCSSLGLDSVMLARIDGQLMLDRPLNVRRASLVDFDALVLDVSMNALAPAISGGPDVLAGAARRIKDTCRRELISSRIFSNPEMNQDKDRSEVDALMSLYFINQLLGEIEKAGYSTGKIDMIARQHLNGIWSMIDLHIPHKTEVISALCLGTLTKLQVSVPSAAFKEAQKQVIAHLTAMNEEEFLYYLCMELSVMVEDIVPEAGKRKELIAKAA